MKAKTFVSLIVIAFALHLPAQTSLKRQKKPLRSVSSESLTPYIPHFRLVVDVDGEALVDEGLPQKFNANVPIDIFAAVGTHHLTVRHDAIERALLNATATELGPPETYHFTLAAEVAKEDHEVASLSSLIGHWQYVAEGQEQKLKGKYKDDDGDTYIGYQAVTQWTSTWDLAFSRMEGKSLVGTLTRTIETHLSQDNNGEAIDHTYYEYYDGKMFRPRGTVELNYNLQTTWSERGISLNALGRGCAGDCNAVQKLDGNDLGFLLTIRAPDQIGLEENGHKGPMKVLRRQ